MKLMHFREGLCGPGSTAGHCARHTRPGKALCVGKNSGNHDRKRAKLQRHMYRPCGLLNTPEPTHESKNFGSKKISLEGADHMHRNCQTTKPNQNS